ncbi:type I-F CRISPR-associated endoribonuclease Cas6/Csy4 [Pelagibaculum spongiae]|uniref:Type I-F CRISPR-associated endoribonuclease Cas6/Csy4 n=1 Tax=Pelagibaculum spongiae TaxID=2080658 RepID=A0A2V1H100_9GAMM|nr:type I-F CRISPR-associated endoribonuclease Cas6/Csy4 [Pelagibaculum spongiae]PVZ69763.1 type I-F CRISPR-associated endoribonuclease Cas6/Csy4 [Pelagibaculum spongiae]
MKVYIDLTLLPSDDIGQNFLWQKMFQQIHLALAELNNAKGVQPVALAFPGYRVHGLGNKLRLMAIDSADLHALDLSQWLDRLMDYVHISSVRDVPEKVEKYVCYSRQRSKTGVERLARRYAKRHNIELEQAMAHYQDFQPKYLKAPFIQMQSLSGDQQFRLFIERTWCAEASAEATADFGSYGLGKNTALPHF